MAHALHYGYGAPVRRLPAILLETTGVTMTQGAITRDALKQASGVVGNAYRDARAGSAMRQSLTPMTPVGRWAESQPS